MRGGVNPLATQSRIRVKSQTKNLLDKLVDHLKPHRQGRVTYDDAIDYLFEKRRQIGSLQRSIKKLETDNTDLKTKLEAGIPTPPMEAPPPSSLQTPPETVGPEPPTPKPTETPEWTVPIPSRQCHFYAEAEDGLVHCSKDYDAKGIIHRVTEVICAMCWDRIAKRVQDNKRLSEAYPCLRRFQGQDGDFRCVIHPPKATRLSDGLKTCQACQDRLTEEIAQQKGIIIRPQYYLDCGAQEKKDDKAGWLVNCPHTAKTEWQPIAVCKEKECPRLKIIHEEYGR